MGIRVKPVNYNISLYDLELGGGFSYQGTVKIDLDVKEAPNKIVLNAHQLKVHDAQLIPGSKGGKIIEASVVVVMLD